MNKAIQYSSRFDIAFDKKVASVTSLRRSNLSWEMIFRLPFEPVWFVSLLVLAYVSLFVHLYFSVNAKCVGFFKEFKMTEIFYVLDGMYFLDVVLMLSVKYIPRVRQSTKHRTRPLAVLVFEIIAVLPLELAVPVTSDTAKKVYCILYLNRCFKMVRISHLFHVYDNLVNTRMFMRKIEMVSSTLFITMVVYSVMCNVVCFRICPPDHSCYSYSIIVLITNAVTTTTNTDHLNSLAWKICVPMGCLFVYFFVFNFMRGHLMRYLINDYFHQVSFENKLCVIKLRQRALNTPLAVREKIKLLYSTIWKRRGGYFEEKNVLKKLPKVVYKEMMLDVYWNMFKHSKLFRYSSVAFLRSVAAVATHEFLLPGDFVTRRGERMEKMFYVASGIIHLISQEDLESPVLSLTTGTCLGDVSLLVGNVSKTSLRCKTYCEVHFLDKRNFVSVASKYPEEYSRLRRDVNDRYGDAKLLKKTSEANRVPSDRQIDIVTLMWINNTSHKLMAVDEESTYRHEIKNVFLLNEINRVDFNRLDFSAKHLDSMALAGRIEVETDTVFVSSKCPCVLQPGCFVVIMWEVLIVALSMAMFFIVPYFAFVASTFPDWYYPVMIFVTLVHWCDVYVQLSTSVHSARGLLITHKDILGARLTSVGFWADLVSCVPCETFTSIVLMDTGDQYTARLHLNRLTKLWRVQRVFSVLEKNFSANFTSVRYVKFTWTIVSVVFVFYCALFGSYSTDTNRLLFISLQILTGTGFHDGDYHNTNVVFIAIYIVSRYIHMSMYAYIGSAYILPKLNMYKIQQWCKSALKLETTHVDRIKNFVYTQWDDNVGERFISSAGFFHDLPRNLYAEMLRRTVEDVLSTFPLFEELLLDAIVDVCGVSQITVYPEQEVVAYAGDVADLVVIVFRGCVEVTEGASKTSSEDSPVVVNLLEVLFDVPSAVTVATKTSCLAIKIHCDELKTVLARCGKLDDVMTAIRQERDVETELVKLRDEASKAWKSAGPCVTVSPSFYNFAYNVQEHSYDEFDYHVPFDRIYPFHFVRFFLLHRTINSDGRFLFAWELSRCFFAVLTCMCHLTWPLIHSKYSYVLYILDSFALADIYVRMHVTYHNSDGLLVKHPLKTCAHYLHCGFFVDLFALCPLDVLCSRENNALNYLLRCNRLVQMHRYVQFVRKVYDSKVRPPGTSYCLVYAPIMLVMCNLFGGLLMNLECEYDPIFSGSKNFTRGLRCREDSLLANSDFPKPINPLRAHLYCVSIATNAISGMGLQGFRISNDFQRYYLTFLSIYGLYVMVIIATKILTLFSFRHASLLRYQEATHSLKNFMDAVGVSANLKHSVTSRCEFHWNRLKGENMIKMLSPLTKPLKLDVLYEHYGNRLYDKSVFRNKTVSFYRNFLEYARYELQVKGAFLETINDIESRTCVMYEGRASVVAADGTVLAWLHSGSIFGNLEDSRQSRQLVSIIANSHVDVLHVESSRFHKILSYYPNIYDEFLYLKARFASYIPSKYGDDDPEGSRYGSSNEPIVKTRVRRCLKISSYFDPNSNVIKCLNIANLLLSCYLGCILELYHFGSLDFSIGIVTSMYMCDVLYIFHYFVKIHTAYEDDAGDLITDLDLIRKKNFENKFLVAVTVASLLPLDLIALFVPLDFETKVKVFGALRLNRLLRLTYVLDYVESAAHKFNAKVFVIRFGYVMMWSSLFIFGVATFIAVASSWRIQDANGDHHVMSSADKLKWYGYFFYLSVNCFMFTSITTGYHPYNAELIVLYVAVVLVFNVTFCVCAGQIFAILYEYNNALFQFRNFVHRVELFMYREDVSVSLINNTLEHVKHVWETCGGVVFPDLLREAPRYILDAVLNDAFAHLVIDHPVFVHCHKDCLRQIVQAMRNDVYTENSYVQFRDTVDETMYFVFSGEVAVLGDDEVRQNDVVCVLGNGESFGCIQGLYRRTPHKYSYKTVKDSVIVSLDLCAWEHLLVFFPASKEKMYAAVADYGGY